MTEKQAETYASLVANADTWLEARGWTHVERGRWELNAATVQAIHLDARELQPPGQSIKQACHIYNDPNHVEEWVLTPEFHGGCPPFTTSVSTLGCNVNGLKRMEYERRVLWYDRVNSLTDSLVKSWHDACLFSVGGPAQWAYLITAPSVWRDDVTDYCMKAAAKTEGQVARPQVAWLKADPDAYKRLQDRLFLTRKELGDAA